MTAALHPFESRRLWSLWGMLGKYAAGFLALDEIITEMLSNLRQTRLAGGTPREAVVKALAGIPIGPDPEKAKAMQASVNVMVDAMTSRFQMPSVSAQGVRISGLLSSGASHADIETAIRELRNRLRDELNAKEFLYIPPERVAYYADKMQFGQEVNDRFPAAIDDIEGAGKCLAVGEGTACVLHLMRVMESGLKALAGSLKIGYAPSWESYLTQIALRINAKRKTKGVKWRRDEPFYRDVSGDLLTVKQAWRNPTMHVVRKYAPDEAEEIFKAVRTFMRRLATRLPS